MKHFLKNRPKTPSGRESSSSGMKWKVIVSLFILSFGSFVGMFFYYGFDPGLLASLSFYQNLANPSVRIVRIQEGLRKEEIADIMAQKLNWDEKTKLEFVNAHLALNSPNLEGRYFPKTYLIQKDEDPLGVTAVMLREFSKENGKVKKILEKPKEVVSHLVNAGGYIFSPVLFDEIDRTSLSTSGEYAITDTIQQMIEKGNDINMVESKSMWMDAVHSWDFLKANAVILEGYSKKLSGKIESGATIKGDVVVGENTVVHAGCYIVGPVVIGNNCSIGPNAVILPSTAIGDNTSIDSSVEIHNSIIMNDVRIGSGTYISNSIIGANNNIGPHFSTEVGRDLMIEMKGILHHAEMLGTVIGDDNNIANRVLIKAGKIISNNCNLEAGITVHKDIPPDSIVV